MMATEGIYAVVGALIGGVLAKLIDHLISPKEKELDAEAQFRRDLLADNNLLREKFSQNLVKFEESVATLREDVDHWRLRFEELSQKNASLVEEHKRLLSDYEKIKIELETLKVAMTALVLRNSQS